MPDLLSLLERWWKFILGFSLSIAVISLVVSFLTPSEYLSVATALPANSAAADKARIFNENIESLYPEVGSPDELDKIEGTAALDTIYIAASVHFKLPNHYSLKEAETAQYRAAIKLKSNSKITRSAYGELQVKVWDKNKNMAASLANFLMQQMQAIHQQLQTQRTEIIIQKLQQQIEFLKVEYNKLSDSVPTHSNPKLIAIKSKGLEDQLQKYETALSEHRVALDAKTPVLLVVENARPAALPDKPRHAQIILLSFFAALIFSFLLSIFLETRKSQ